MKKTVLMIIVLTLIGKFSGFLREMIMSAQIGANIYTDIYNYSVSASTVLTSVVVTGIGSALIPILSEADMQGRMNAFFDRLLSAIFPILLLGVLSLYLLSPLLLLLIAPGLAPDMRELAIQYSRLLSINLFTISLQALLRGYLQKNGKFFFPASMALPLNATVITGIFLSRPDNIFPMVISSVVGQVMILAWLSIPLSHMKYRPRLAIKHGFFQDELGVQFLKMLPPTLIGTAAVQLNTIIDRALASLLPSGNASYLNYADKLQGIVYSIMVVSLLTVLFPKQAEYASKKEYKKLYALTRENLSLTLLIVFPLSFGMMFLSQEITQIAFMRNQFTSADAFVTGNILLCYGGIVLFQSTVGMFSRTFYARKETKKQMVAAMLSILTNITCNLLLIRPWGVYGLALATTFSTFVQMAALIYMSRPYYREYNEKMVTASMLKYLFASVLMVGVLVGFRSVFWQRLGLYGYSFISVIIGIVVYFGVLFLLRTDELMQLKQMTTDFMNRMRRSA